MFEKVSYDLISRKKKLKDVWHPGPYPSWKEYWQAFRECLQFHRSRSCFLLCVQFWPLDLAPSSSKRPPGKCQSCHGQLKIEIENFEISILYTYNNHTQLRHRSYMILARAILECFGALQRDPEKLLVTEQEGYKLAGQILFWKYPHVGFFGTSS